MKNGASRLYRPVAKSANHASLWLDWACRSQYAHTVLETKPAGELQKVARGSTLTFNDELNLMGHTLTKAGAGMLAINNQVSTVGGTVDVQQGMGHRPCRLPLHRRAGPTSCAHFWFSFGENYFHLTLTTLHGIAGQLTCLPVQGCPSSAIHSRGNISRCTG